MNGIQSVLPQGAPVEQGQIPLEDLLRMQAEKSAQESAKRSQDMQMGIIEPSVAQQLVTETMGGDTRANMMSKMQPGIQQQGQKMLQQQLAQALAGGVAGQPAPNMQKLAGGGIVAFAGPDGSEVEEKGGIHSRFYGWLARQGINAASLANEQLEQLRDVYLQTAGPAAADAVREAIPERRAPMPQAGSVADDQMGVLGQVLSGAGSLVADRVVPPSGIAEVARETRDAPNVMDGSMGIGRGTYKDRPAIDWDTVGKNIKAGPVGSIGRFMRGVAPEITRSIDAVDASPLDMPKAVLDAIGIDAQDLERAYPVASGASGIDPSSAEFMGNISREFFTGPFNLVGDRIGEAMANNTPRGSAGQQTEQTPEQPAPTTPAVAAPRTAPREYTDELPTPGIAQVEALKAMGVPEGGIANAPQTSKYDERIAELEAARTANKRGKWDKFNDWALAGGRSRGTSIGSTLTGAGTGLRNADMAEMSQNEKLLAELSELEANREAAQLDRASREKISAASDAARIGAANIQAAASALAAAGKEGMTQKQIGDALRDIRTDEALALGEIDARIREAGDAGWFGKDASEESMLRQIKYEQDQLINQRFREAYIDPMGGGKSETQSKAEAILAGG